MVEYLLDMSFMVVVKNVKSEPFFPEVDKVNLIYCVSLIEGPGSVMKKNIEILRGGGGGRGKTGGQEKEAFITELTDLNNSDFVTK